MRNRCSNKYNVLFLVILYTLNSRTFLLSYDDEIHIVRSGIELDVHQFIKNQKLIINTLTTSTIYKVRMYILSFTVYLKHIPLYTFEIQLRSQLNPRFYKPCYNSEIGPTTFPPTKNMFVDSMYQYKIHGLISLSLLDSLERKKRQMSQSKVI